MRPDRLNSIMIRCWLTFFASVAALLIVVWLASRGAWFAAVPFGLYAGFMIWIGWSTGCLAMDEECDREWGPEEDETARWASGVEPTVIQTINPKLKEGGLQ